MIMDTDVGAGCVPAGGGSAVLLAEFRTWLDRERGLSPVSVRCYSKQAKYFLAAVGGPVAVSGLDAGMVTAFMVDYSRDRNTWSAKAMVTSLRAFLRFAHATGRTTVPLAGAVPAVASWRLAALPCGLPAAEIERLLAGCDRETKAGLRDYAVLSLLARLGCAARKPRACSSATSAGGQARSRSWARAAAPSGFPCRPRPGRRSPPG
jgi:integrase/recombinase XerD